MRYSGLELLMENLKQLIYCDDNPVVSNHPLILYKRPQIQVLYEELSSMIDTLFVDGESELNELQQVKELKTRFKDVAEDAHSIVGVFVYAINFKSSRPCRRYDLIKYLMICKSVERSINYKCSLNLKNVMRSVKSIKKEYITILDTVTIHSSQNINSLKTQPTISCTKNLAGSQKVLEDMVVGINHDAKLIRDQLAQDQKQLDVVSIVGMGGSGKTTLATKVFNDPFVVYHFHVRVWVTVSQIYEKRDLLIQILNFMDVQLVSTASDSQLREKVHKSLMGKRFLIVIDDIWNNEAWDDLKLFFPNDNTGSRIMLTSRLKEVALHAKSHGFVHQLEYLTDEESWELLRKKVFHGDDCPEWLNKIGRQIAKKCRGLPLAVVVIAGVLAKEAVSIDSWERIGRSVSSYIVSDQNGYVDMLALSYDHLPPHLKECFLYLGGFPEDHKFRVTNLIWLWMAEGFIQESQTRSWEEIGEEYLMELVDRNLVVVADRKFNGDIKACSVHDLLRELCLEKATKEHFCLKIHTPMSYFSTMRRYKLRRIFTNVDFLVNNVYDTPSPRLQSLLCFHSGLPLINVSKGYFHSYPLLMVLDLQKCQLQDFPQSIELLVLLRYLAFWYAGRFPSSICNIWSLQTLIVKSSMSFSLPKTISNLVNLRHLRSDRPIYFESIEKPMNLQTISRVAFADEAKTWAKYIPGIKKLTSSTRADDDHDFEPLTSLETFMWITVSFQRLINCNLEYPKIHMRLPASLRKLSLVGCYLPWCDMSIIQSLPNLEVLKILKDAFWGPKWEACEGQFRELKFLKLHGLNIQQWKASSIHFPCLRRLVVERCKFLEEIPLDLGDIPTLELIDVDDSSHAITESLDRIQEEQQNFGNFDLKFNVKKAMESRHSHLKSADLRFW